MKKTPYFYVNNQIIASFYVIPHVNNSKPLHN